MKLRSDGLQGRACSASGISLTPQMLMEGTLRLYNSPCFEGSLRAAEEIAAEVFTSMIERSVPAEP